MASSSSSDEKMIKLVSSDDKQFEVGQTTAIQSQTIRHLIEDDCAGNAIPLPNVTGKVLAKVLEYLKKHEESSSNVDDDGLKSWDVEFMKIGTDELYDLLLAANYLDIRGLLDLACQTTADMVKGKTPDEIRNMFKIKNDFSLEEEEEIKRENSWAFE